SAQPVETSNPQLPGATESSTPCNNGINNGSADGCDFADGGHRWVRCCHCLHIQSCAGGILAAASGGDAWAGLSPLRSPIKCRTLCGDGASF
ncbi:MAG: hypothetical protein ACPIOQ_85170, partial [Promethearchaeia archaeon]